MTAPGVVAAVGVLLLAAGWRGLAWRHRRSAVARRLARPAGQATPVVRRRPVPLFAPPGVVVRRLEAAAVAADPADVWLGWWGALVVGVPLAVVGAGPGLGVVVAVALVVGPVLGVWAFGDRADRRVDAALPDALAAVAAGLRSGGSLVQSIGEAARATPGVLGADLAALDADLGAGITVVDALDAWAARRPLPGVRLAVAALALGAETGGAHARSVDGVAATIRSRSAITDEVRALSSQARFSGLVIALAPIAFGALAALGDGRTADFLFRTPVGVACLTAGLGLDTVAAVWMHRLAAVDT